MCDPVTAGVAVTGALVGMSAAKKPNMPAMPEMPEPQQAQKMPDEQARRRSSGGAGGGPIGGGQYNTMLTGPGGVDTGLLSLAKNTLLGQ